MKLVIDKKEFKNQVALAPMAGVSNPAYMKICEEMGCGYAVSELISSEAIIRNNKKTFDMLNGIEDLKMPVAIQIFGVEVSVVLFNSGFEDPSGEVCHHLREDIFAFVHYLRLLAATNLAKRSLQIVKCQRAI